MDEALASFCKAIEINPRYAHARAGARGQSGWRLPGTSSLSSRTAATRRPAMRNASVWPSGARSRTYPGGVCGRVVITDATAEGLYRNLRYSLLTDRIFAVTLALVGSKGHKSVGHRQITPSAVLGIPEGRFGGRPERSAYLVQAGRKRRVGQLRALKQTFESADQVGNCVVFDVGNNRFRLFGAYSTRPANFTSSA